MERCLLDFARRTPGTEPGLEARACLGLGLSRRSLGHADFVPVVEQAGRLDEVESLVTTAAALAADHGFAGEQRELALVTSGR